MARATTPPPPTLVLLVRHGQTPTTGKVLPGRAAGLHLAEKGEQQAAGRRRADHRAPVGQAEGGGGLRIAARAHPGDRRPDQPSPGLRTRRNTGLLEADFGEWTGAELKRLYKLPEWRTVQRNPSGFRFPGGESFTEMQTRITGAVQKLCVAHPGETVVAVSHADPIKAAVAHAMGTHLDLFQRIVVSPCSVSAILYGVDGPIVLAVNSTGDLTALVPS